MSCYSTPTDLHSFPTRRSSDLDTGIDFTNQVKDGSRNNSFLFRNFYNGGGVAIGDINNDRLADVFLTSNMADNKLRSEEHTSELQSLAYLVCRLLLEKKEKTKQ